MIKISAAAFTTLTISIAQELSARDQEIQRHHEEIAKLKQEESQYTLELANRDYSLGVLKGQVTDLTERLQLSEESNKNFFNTNESLVQQNRDLLKQIEAMWADNLNLLKREVYLTSELDTIQEGKAVNVSKDNVRSLMLSIKSNDTIFIAEHVHKLMDIPLVEAMAFVKDTLPDANEHVEIVGPIDDDETSGVEGVTAKEVESQVG